MWRILLIIFILTTIYSCRQKLENKANYPKHVGDIAFDEKIDDPNFKVCDEYRIAQYFNFHEGIRYKGEKVKINEHFKEGFKEEESIHDNGYVTIQFIVNCEGKTGMFRVQGMDFDCKEKEFDKTLTDQLLILTKKLDGWIVDYKENTFDYHQYLAFKLENGKLTEIMP
jgi:hypothetical protein